MLVAFDRFFDRRSLSFIRIKISERHSGRADCLEGEAKRTSVRERRLKGKMPPRMPRSVRTSHTRKARSSERACKRKNRHGFPCLRHFKTGGEVGIRTPDTLVGYTRLAGEHLRPLGQLSANDATVYTSGGCAKLQVRVFEKTCNHC